ncbi:hypothetical protein [Lacibacter sp.]|uniref:hypothetical protein n=1 Tax=Lacibacter sp. TaxID=1915409 RepID=UPI002B4AFD13|nr:hypothetical protein [Lacibacter sp.]HLP39536.1 hypothetical protein [Lacibacter sp.]
MDSLWPKAYNAMPGLLELSKQKSSLPGFSSSSFTDNIYSIDGTLTGNRFVDLGTSTLSFGKGSNVNLHLFNNGNVWLGNGTPTDAGYKLDVNGSIKTNNVLSIVNGSAQMDLKHEGGYSFLYNRTAADFVIGTNNVERLRIHSGGNILIGTTVDAGYKFDLNGKMRIQHQDGLTFQSSVNNQNFLSGINNGGEHYINFSFHSSNSFASRIVSKASGENGGSNGIEFWVNGSGGDGYTVTAADRVMNVAGTHVNITKRLQSGYIYLDGADMGAEKKIYVKSDMPSAGASNLSISAGDATNADRGGGNLILSTGAGATTGPSGIIQFFTANTGGAGTNTKSEVARITGGGALLLGTTTDDGVNKLQVNGRVKFSGLTNDNAQQKVIVSDATGNLFLRDASTIGSAGNIYTTNGSLAGNRFVDLSTASTLSFGKGTASYLHLFNNGNISIGSANPVDNGYKLEVNGVFRTTSVPRFDGGGLILNRNGSEAYINFQKDGAQLAQIRMSATGQLKFTDGGGGTVSNLFSQNLVQLAGSGETIAKVNTSGGASIAALSVNYGVGYTPNGNFYPLIVRQTAPTIEMVDGFGTGISFIHHDLTNVNNQVAGILTERIGNDAAAHLKFFTANGSTIVERLRITNTGNLLVGTTTDDGVNKLQVSGRVKFTGLTNDNTQTKLLVSDASGNVFLRDASTISGGGSSNWQLSGNILFNNNGGFVGIGTSNPQSALAVNGTITTQKIKVTLSGWPDYVFAPDYKLPSLREVEAFIQKNRHLPGIVPAAEVEKNGLDLGENQAALLQKVEELTLYMIEMNKRVEQLEKENEALKKKANSRKK